MTPKDVINIVQIFIDKLNISTRIPVSVHIDIEDEEGDGMHPYSDSEEANRHGGSQDT